MEAHIRRKEDVPYDKIKETLIEAINFGQKLEYYKDNIRSIKNERNEDSGLITQILWRKFPKEKSISIEEFEVKAGYKSGKHSHTSHEYIIFYYGEITLWMDGKVTSHTAPTCIHIPPNKLHNVWTNDDKMMGVAVFIPSQSDFEIKK